MNHLKKLIKEKQFILIVLCSLFFFSSCNLIFPPKPAIEFIPPEEAEEYFLDDDLNYKDMEQAINQSLRYYKRLPDTAIFDFGDMQYSVREMENSHKLFLEIIKTYTGKERTEKISRMFHLFESKNEKGQAFFTGYYEPLLDGNVEYSENFPIPLYEKPADMLKAYLEDFKENLKNEWIIGKVKGDRFIPYDDRDEIVYQNSLNQRAQPLVYVKNHIELFFLQIQGSGIIRLRDGQLKRYNYAAQNGHSYRAIGKLLKDEIPPEEMSLQSIKTYLYNNPQKIRETLNYNPSYTFFREVDEGPLGYINVPLTPKRSIAMDWRLIPKGCLGFISTTSPVMENDQVVGWSPIKRFVLVQDTGGAIRGHGRADIFWGFGDEAELKAGHMKQEGKIFILVARKKFLNQNEVLVLD